MYGAASRAGRRREGARPPAAPAADRRAGHAGHGRSSGRAGGRRPVSDAALLQRRLAAFRGRNDSTREARDGPRRAAIDRSAGLAERLALAVDGVVVATDRGRVVRRDVAPITAPL